MKVFELAGLQGFATDLNECLINLGLRQDIVRVLDAEFTTNMGMLCTALTITGTEHKIHSNWRFSQFGILYIVDDRKEYELTGIDGSKSILNHTEFSLVIAIMACRENLIGALIQGFKNPFRMSLFYQSVLLHCLISIDDSCANKAKVLDFLEKHKRKEYAEHEPFFNEYLKIEV